MIIKPKLSKGQWLFLASTARTLAEGILLGVSATFFLPEVFQLKEAISFFRYILLFFVGLIILVIGVILQKKGER